MRLDLLNKFLSQLGWSPPPVEPNSALRDRAECTSTNTEPQLWELEPRVLMDAAPIDPALLDDGMDAAFEFEVADVELGSEWELSVDEPSTALSATGDVHLVVVDASVEDRQLLIDQILAHDAGVEYQFLFLADDTNGLDQVANSLEQQSFSAVHILSHGQDGAIHLGSQNISAASLTQSAAALERWGDALDSEADIFLYGCDVSSSEAGQQFVRQFALLTGADVAASDDLTGASQLGGDWELEYEVGTIEESSLFQTVEVTWDHTLAAVAVPAVEGQGSESDGTVAMDANGNFVVVGVDTSGADSEIVAEIYNFDGTTRTAQFTVNTDSAGEQTQAAVSTDANGNFVVVWKSENPVGTNTQVFFRLFDAQGNALSGDVQVSDSSDVNYFAENPTVDMNAAGEFVVAWSGHGAGDDQGIFARRYDASGNAVGGEILVNATISGTQDRPDVALNDQGNFAVAWDEDWDIFLQRFDSDGNTVFGETSMSSFSDWDAAVDLNNSNQLVVAWNMSFFW